MLVKQIGKKTQQYIKQKEYVKKIENWFLECKYNPKYTYCRRKVMEDYKVSYGRNGTL